MIAHTTLTVSDYRKSKAFFAKALAPLGYTNNMEDGDAAGFNDGKNTDFWIGKKPASYRCTSHSRHTVPSRRAPSTRPRWRQVARTTASQVTATIGPATTPRSCSTRTETTSKRCGMTTAKPNKPESGRSAPLSPRSGQSGGPLPRISAQKGRNAGGWLGHGRLATQFALQLPDASPCRCRSTKWQGARA